MSLPQQHNTTIEEYESLPENIRAEVFDGQLQYMANPSQMHQTILQELSSILNSYAKKQNGTCVALSSPFDIKLNDNPLTIVQPDLMIICNQNKLDGKRCNGAPDFIIEISSPGNAADDYIRKLFYYKNYGVCEYWIVDFNRATVTVNWLEKDIINIPYTFYSVIKVNIFDNLYIDFKEIGHLKSNIY